MPPTAALCVCSECRLETTQHPSLQASVQGRMVGRKELLAHRRREQRSRLCSAIELKENRATWIAYSEGRREEVEPVSGDIEEKPTNDCWDPLKSVMDELASRRDGFQVPETLVFVDFPSSKSSRPGSLPSAAVESCYEVNSGQFALKYNVQANSTILDHELWLYEAMADVHDVKTSDNQCTQTKETLLQQLEDELKNIEKVKADIWARQQDLLLKETPHELKHDQIDTAAHLSTSVFDAHPMVLGVHLLVAVLHVLCRMSIDHCSFVLAALHNILSLSMEASPRSAQRRIVSDLPVDIRTIVNTLNLRPVARAYVCCPACFNCYDPADYPDHCGYQATPSSDICGTPLRRASTRGGKTITFPVRQYFYHSMKAWMGRLLSRRDIASSLDRELAPRLGDEAGDIWDSDILQDFLGPDGRRYLDCKTEGRYVFSLCMDSFNPFFNREAGQKVSVGAMYMVCLNLPPSLRYRIENMYLIGIIPGPKEPSLDQINHLLRPFVDDLIEFWKPGVTFSGTVNHPRGRLVRCVVIPLVCDLPAARSMAGFGSHRCSHFCSYCLLPLRDINSLDVDNWPLRSSSEHRELAERWKNAASEKIRSELFNEFGIRYSELLRLEYWDPIAFTMIDVMHCNLAGNIRRHCREILGMDLKLPDGPAKATQILSDLSEEEWALASSIFRTGTNAQLRKLPVATLRHLCLSVGTLPFHGIKDELIHSLLSYRNEHGFGSNGPGPGRSNQSLDEANLARGRVLLANAPSWAGLHRLLKATLLQLCRETLPSYSEDELRNCDKATLTDILLERQALSSEPAVRLDSQNQGHLTDIAFHGPEKSETGPVVEDIHNNSVEDEGRLAGIPQTLFGSSDEGEMTSEKSVLSIDDELIAVSVADDFGPDDMEDLYDDNVDEVVHGEYILRTMGTRRAMATLERHVLLAMCQARFKAGSLQSNVHDLELMTNNDLIDALLSWDEDEESANLSGDVLLATMGHLPQNRSKKTVALGPQALSEIWGDMRKTLLPTWFSRAPSSIGSTRYGKPSADQWRAACTVNLVITLVRLWGPEPKSSNKHRMLENFLDLATATKLVTMRSMTPERIEQYKFYMMRYLRTLRELYLGTGMTPNHHLSLHMPDFLAGFGPTHSWRCFVFERCNFLLQQIPTNQKVGELERTLLDRFCMGQAIRAIMLSSGMPEALKSLTAAFARVFQSEVRGTLWNDILSFEASDPEPATNSRRECLSLPVINALRTCIPGYDVPREVLTGSSFSHRGVKYARAFDSPGDSHVIFNKESDEIWSAGQIQQIFFMEDPRSIPGGSRSLLGPFFVVNQFVPLTEVDASQDYYRQYPIVAGRLFYNMFFSEPCVLTTTNLLCHFACTPYETPNIPHECVHVLPLDRD